MFLGDFIPFQGRLAHYGMYNALTQVVLKIASPGIPDFYQGTELWDFSLVDPDNRRSIDYRHRQQLLTQLISAEEEPSEDFYRMLLTNYTDGRIKLFIMRTLLKFRCQHPELFQNGEYQPLETLGEKRHHLCAFQRTWEDQMIVVVVPRLLYHVIPNSEEPPLGESVWGNTMIILPEHTTSTQYRNILTKETLSTEHVEGSPTLPVARIFNQLPIAMMEQLP